MHAKNPLRELLVWEAHGAALASHFGLNKTLDVLKEHFYWPEMRGDVHNVVSTCSICHKTKSQFHQGLYTLLSIPIRPWDDVSLDFIVALPKTQRGKDAIMIVVDRFSKMAQIIPYHKIDDASYIAEHTSKRSLGCMECLRLLFLTIIQNSYLTSGVVYGSY